MSQKFLSEVTLRALNNATTDTDRFLVSDSGTVKFRTGTQLLSDIGGQAALTNPITGTGTTNYVSKFTGTTTLGNSLLFDNGTNVGIGTSTPSVAAGLGLVLNGQAGQTRLAFKNNYTGDTSSDGVQFALIGGSSAFVFQNRESDGYFSFETNSSERIRITDNGNVGIGTSSPAEKLEVVGNIITDWGSRRIGMQYLDGSVYQFGMSFTASPNRFVNFDAFSDDSDGAFRFRTGTVGAPSEKMRITNAGNVGIGTTTPNYTTSGRGVLDINGSSQSMLALSVGGIGKGFLFHTGTDLLVSNEGNGPIKFNTNGSEKAIITSSGNVGIGTSSPDRPLSIFNTNVAVSYQMSIGYNSSYKYDIGRDDTTGALKFYGVQSGYTGYIFDGINGERMRITSSGNVGIGTTSPGAKLHVAGEGIFDDNTYGRLTLGFASSQNDIYSTTTGFGAWKNFKLNANELIFSSGGTTERMRISSAGNVGIGTTSPATKLEVSGIASFTGSGGRSVVIEGQGAGRIDINGDGSAYAVGIKFNSSPGGTALSGIWNYGSGTSQQWLAIGGTAYNNAALYTLPSGDVGIGTSSPAAILDVNGDALINQLTIGQGPATGQQNTAIGRGALGSMSLASANIALGHLSNADNDSTGLTTIGVELNTNTNLDPLLQDCLAISQYNSNAYSNQVPHIYAPKPINVPANAFTNVISFDIDHYAGAIIEYIIRLNDGGDYAVGTVYTGWKTSGDGTLIDDRQTQFNNMSGFVFSLGFNNTIKLQNTTSNAAWIRITVRGMMTN